MAAVALLAAVVWGERVHDAYIARQLNLSRLSSGKIVFLGTSKIRCAVRFDEAMGQTLAARGAPGAFVRITLSRAVLGDFNPVFDAFRRAPPRLVLIDSDFFTLEPDPYRRAGDPAEIDWRQQARSGLASLVRGDAAFYDRSGEEFNGQVGGAEACRTMVAQRGSEDYATDLSGRRTATAAERAKVLALVRRLEAGGAKVALVQTPRSPAAARAFPRPLADGMARILRRAATEDHLAILGPSPSPPAADFIDAGHMTGAGQALYSDWLAGEIARLLAAGAA